jgi:hypothetical protein
MTVKELKDNLAFYDDDAEVISERANTSLLSTVAMR